MPRPFGNVPIPATADNIVDPGYAWDGTPTKVAMPSGQVAAGLKPGERPAAQNLNWYFNRWATFLDYLDAIEVQNFGNQSSIAIGETFHGFAYDGPMGRRIWAVSDDGTHGKAYGSSDGRVWTADATLAGQSPPKLAAPGCNTDDGVTVLVPATGDGGQNAYVRRASDASPSFDPHAVSTDKVLAMGVEWDPDTKLFVVYGAKTALVGPVSAHAKLWVGSANGGTWTECTHPVYSAPSIFGAVGLGPGTLKVATLLAASPKLLMPTDNTLTTWAEVATLSFTPVCIEYNATQGLFMCLDSVGVMRSSTDGVTWNVRNNLAGLYGTVVPVSLTHRGSLWLALIKVGGSAEPLIIWSKDDGLTWNSVAWPFNASDPIMCAALDNRFGVLTETSGLVSYGLRLA